jgi:hypothetical protein
VSTDQRSSELDVEEAVQQQLHYARAQGDAYGAAVEHLVAGRGSEQRAGDYWIGYAVERARGMYEWVGDRLVWREPARADLHVEITVRDAGDGRFIPGAGVVVTVTDPNGRELGTHAHPLVWHPLLYQYGRDWRFAFDGRYRLLVRVEPPRFMRHDQVNGNRLSEAAEVEFAGVEISRAPGRRG